MNRKLARENAFLLLFEKAIKRDEESAEEVFQKATELRGLEIDDYVRGVFFGACGNAAEIDEIIEKNLLGWAKTRVSTVSMALLRLATYEMLFIDDIPSKVSINEAIELSKKYDDDKTYVFVNGVLNAVLEAIGKK